MAKEVLLTKLLFNALQREEKSTCLDLLGMGADANRLTAEGVAPFHLAVGLEDEELSRHVTEVILAMGGDPNVRTVDGMTPLHIAALAGRCENLDLLLLHGGDPDVLDPDDQTAFDCARASGCDQCMVILQQHQHLTQIGMPTATNDKLASSPRLKNIKSSFKKRYTEAIQCQLAAYDPRLQQLDVTSPDHPVLVTRSQLDHTLPFGHRELAASEASYEAASFEENPAKALFDQTVPFLNDSFMEETEDMSPNFIQSPESFSEDPEFYGTPEGRNLDDDDEVTFKNYDFVHDYHKNGNYGASGNVQMSRPESVASSTREVPQIFVTAPSTPIVEDRKNSPGVNDLNLTPNQYQCNMLSVGGQESNGKRCALLERNTKRQDEILKHKRSAKNGEINVCEKRSACMSSSRMQNSKHSIVDRRDAIRPCPEYKSTCSSSPYRSPHTSPNRHGYTSPNRHGYTSPYRQRFTSPNRHGYTPRSEDNRRNNVVNRWENHHSKETNIDEGKSVLRKNSSAASTDCQRDSDGHHSPAPARRHRYDLLPTVKNSSCGSSTQVEEQHCEKRSSCLSGTAAGDETSSSGSFHTADDSSPTQQQQQQQEQEQEQRKQQRQRMGQNAVNTERPLHGILKNKDENRENLEEKEGLSDLNVTKTSSDFARDLTFGEISSTDSILRSPEMEHLSDVGDTAPGGDAGNSDEENSSYVRRQNQHYEEEYAKMEAEYKKMEKEVAQQFRKEELIERALMRKAAAAASRQQQHDADSSDSDVYQRWLSTIIEEESCLHSRTRTLSQTRDSRHFGNVQNRERYENQDSCKASSYANQQIRSDETYDIVSSSSQNFQKDLETDTSFKTANTYSVKSHGIKDVNASVSMNSSAYSDSSYEMENNFRNMKLQKEDSIKNSPKENNKVVNASVSMNSSMFTDDSVEQSAERKRQVISQSGSKAVQDSYELTKYSQTKSGNAEHVQADNKQDFGSNDGCKINGVDCENSERKVDCSHSMDSNLFTDDESTFEGYCLMTNRYAEARTPTKTSQSSHKMDSGVGSTDMGSNSSAVSLCLGKENKSPNIRTPQCRRNLNYCDVLGEKNDNEQVSDSGRTMQGDDLSSYKISNLLNGDRYTKNNFYGEAHKTGHSLLPQHRDVQKLHSSFSSVRSVDSGRSAGSGRSGTGSVRSVASQQSAKSAASSTGSKASACSCASSAVSVATTVYTDAERGVSLVEVRFPPDAALHDADCSILSAAGSSGTRSDCDHQVGAGEREESEVEVRDISIQASLNSQDSQESSACGEPVVRTVPPEIRQLTHDALREELVQLGDTPGPIMQATRRLYEDRLMKLRSDPDLVKQGTSQKSEFPAEVSAALRGDLDVSALAPLETSMAAAFCDPDPARRWREGTTKASFNYLLLDPRVTANLPLRVKAVGMQDGYKTFLQAIFYVGKGKRSRPYMHFKEAIKALRDDQNQPSPKVSRILDIWSCGQGVISLHIFQNVIPAEAFTREACLIDALGIGRLTNLKGGEVYGAAAAWPGRKRRQLGALLLTKAFRIFLSEGERQIKPADIGATNG